MFQKLFQRFSMHDLLFRETLLQNNQEELSTKEIELIRETWSLLRNDIARFKFLGAEIFIRFFSQYPDYQRQFKSFKDIPINFQQQPKRIDKKLMAHGTYVMYTIGMLVDNLENPAMMEQMLKRLGRNHYRRRVPLLAFEQLRDTLLEHFAERLGSQVFNKKVIIAWHKAFRYLINRIEENFKTLESDLQRSGSYYRLNSLQRVAKQELVQHYRKDYLRLYQLERKRNEYLISRKRNSQIMDNNINSDGTAQADSLDKAAECVDSFGLVESPPSSAGHSIASINQQSANRSKNILIKTLLTLKNSVNKKHAI